MDTVQKWASVEAELFAKLDTLQKRAAAIRAERAPLALLVSLDDVAAKAESDKLRDQLLAIGIEIDDCRAALLQAGERRTAAEQEARATAADARVAAARDLARRRLDAARKIDEQLVALERQFAEFDSIGRQLAGFKDIHNVAGHVLLARFRIERAAWFGAPTFAGIVGFHATTIKDRASLAILEGGLFGRLAAEEAAPTDQKAA